MAASNPKVTAKTTSRAFDDLASTIYRRGSSAQEGPRPTSQNVPEAWLHKDSRVCIVGGGASGVHMASLMKQAGYDNVTVFESAPQLGGKCFTRIQDGIPYEVGYVGNIISEGPNPLEQLVRDYGLQDQEVAIGESGPSSAEGAGVVKRSAVKMNRYDSDTGDNLDDDIIDEEEEGRAAESTAKSGGVKAENNATTHHHDDEFKHSVSNLSSKIRAASFSDLPPLKRLFTRKISDIKEQVSQFFGNEPLVAAAKRYARLHRRLLGTHPYGMPPQPKAENLAQLNMSFVDFLKAHNLLNLVPVFILCPITFSYHFLVELPAFYGLWWYNPTRVTALIDFKKGSLRVPRYTVIKCGWQGLWEKMATTDQIKVQLNASVKSITRPKEDKAGHLVVSASTGGSSHDTTITHEFDLLILACNLKTALPLLTDATEEEQSMANSLSEFTLCSTIFESDTVSGERPIELFPFPKRNNAFGQVFAQVNPRLAVQEVKEGEAPPSSDKRIVYQFLNRSPRPEDIGVLRRRLKMYFDDQSIQKPNVIKQCPWKFFSHFPADQVVNQAWPWRLQAMQGANNTVFVGASASMDSVNEILLYNQWVMSRLGLCF